MLGIKEKMIESLLTDENISSVCNEIIGKYCFEQGEKPCFLLTREKDQNCYVCVAAMKYHDGNWVINSVKQSVKASELCKTIIKWKEH